LSDHIVNFGTHARLRMVPGPDGVVVHQEKHSPKGQWIEVSAVYIPNGSVGDTCAALATHYDRLLNDKMKASKQV
jgi:hypothetical protein